MSLRRCARTTVMSRRSLARTIGLGALAGAVGTFAIDASTYLDMALRGRPSSDVPEKTVDHYAQQLGVDFGDGDRAQNRLSGVAALAGYATGVAGGVAYALAHRFVDRVPAPLRGLGLGVGVMALTDTSSSVAGATDPRTWGTSGWLSDLVPHAVYGLVTASTFDSWSSNHRL